MSIAVVAPASAVTADTTVTVSSQQVAPFGQTMLGGNLSPWGVYWPDPQFNPLIKDMGMGMMRVGHAEKFYVDMEAWYPTKGGTPNWKAGGALGAGRTFDDQIAWWKSLNMPIMYTLSDELSTAMLKPDGTLDYAEVARAWSLHIKHIIDSGVDLRYIEIGNEADIAPGEGIEYPPVESSRGGQPGSGRFIDPSVQPASANDYIKLFNAVYPAIKAVAPNVKIAAYPSGQGPITAPYFPYDYLFTQNQYKPDWFPFHLYPFGNSSTPAQRMVDATWYYGGNYYIDWEGRAARLQDTLASWGAANTEIGITEFDYDVAAKYTNANQMWDAVFYASAITNAANAGIRNTAFWDTFAGSNTDSLISDIWTDPTPKLRSQGLAMRLLKQFATPGRVVLQSTVNSSDKAVAYDGANQVIPDQSLSGKRVEVLATQDSSGMKLLLINKNVTTAHTVAVSVPSSASQASVDLYTNRASLDSQTPTRTTVPVSAGSLTVSMPALSMAVVTIGGTTPPPPPTPDTNPPSVTVNAPPAGAVVSGPTTLSAIASDAESGISRVDFLVDGQLVASDSTSPYSTTWDASSAAPGSHTIQARAVDGAGNVGTSLVSVTVAAPPPADTTPPTVKITAPAAGSATVGAVTISADASDSQSGIDRVEFRVDGQLVGSDTSSPYSVSWNAPTGAGMTKGPVVSFSFDDSNLAEYTDYFPILRAAGFPGTLYVVTDVVGEGDKLTLPQLGEMRDAGWEISSHTSDHWSNLPSNPTTADFEAPVAKAKQWLDANGFPNSGFASPNGYNDDMTEAVVKKYHPYNRTSWGTASLPVSDPYLLPASPIDYADLTAVTADLDAIQANNGWVIYLDHAWEAPTVFQQLVNEVKRRGIPVRTVRDVLQGAAQSGPHTIDVTAFDKAGNSAKDSIVVNGSDTTPPPADTTPPAVTLTAPLSGAIVSGQSTLAAIASDAGSGVARVDFLVDGQLVGSDSTSPYSMPWDATNAAPGTHVIQATATDGAGNTATSLVSVTVAPPPDTTPPGPVTGFTALPTNSVSLTWRLPSDSDFASVRVLRSTVGYATDATATSSQQIIYEGVANGFVDHPSTSATAYYTAFARDTSGNWSAAATVSESPVTAIVAPTTIAVPLRKAAAIRIRLVDDKGNGINGKTVTLRRPDGLTVTMTPVTGTGIADGTYYATMKRLRQASTPVVVSFAGDHFFKPSTDTINLVPK